MRGATRNLLSSPLLDARSSTVDRCLSPKSRYVTKNAVRASDPADTTPQLYPPYPSVFVLLDPVIHVLAVKVDALADAHDWDGLVEDEMLDSLLRPA